MRVDYSEREGESQYKRWVRVQTEFNTIYSSPLPEGVGDVARVNDRIKLDKARARFLDYHDMQTKQFFKYGIIGSITILAVLSGIKLANDFNNKSIDNVVQESIIGK